MNMRMRPPSTNSATYRLDLEGARKVVGEEGPLFATVDAERSMRRVDVKIRIVGHTALFQRGVGVRRTVQVSGFGEVQGNGVKIPAGFFEVHCKLKRHGLGALMMNAMISWAHDYHPDAMILPIGVTRGAFDSDDTPVPFYERYGFHWTALSDANKHYSFPRPVAQTCPISLTYPMAIAVSPIEPDAWRN